MPCYGAPPTFNEAQTRVCFVFIQVAACTVMKWTGKRLQIHLDAAGQVLLFGHEKLGYKTVWNKELGHTNRMIKSLTLLSAAYKDLNEDAVIELASKFHKKHIRIITCDTPRNNISKVQDWFLLLASLLTR